MKSWIISVPFSGAKFAKRYGLDSQAGDFSMNGNVLTVPDRVEHLVTDEPPIFEGSDLPTPSSLAVAIQVMIDRPAPPVDPDLKAILIEWRKELKP